MTGWRDAQLQRLADWAKATTGRVRVTFSGHVWWVETADRSFVAYSLAEAMDWVYAGGDRS